MDGCHLPPPWLYTTGRVGVIETEDCRVSLRVAGRVGQPCQVRTVASQPKPPEVLCDQQQHYKTSKDNVISLLAHERGAGFCGTQTVGFDFNCQDLQKNLSARADNA